MSLNLCAFLAPFHQWYSPQLVTTRVGRGVAVDTQLNRPRINIEKPTVGDNPKLRHEPCINPATDPGDHQSSTSIPVETSHPPLLGSPPRPTLSSWVGPPMKSVHESCVKTCQQLGNTKSLSLLMSSAKPHYYHCCIKIDRGFIAQAASRIINEPPSAISEPL